MRLSIIVILHDMQREAARTLLSLSTQYQRGVLETQYEVIVIDNGPKNPVSETMVRAFGLNFRHVIHETTSISPVDAMNHGASIASGDMLAFIVDGARMASPGLVASTLHGLGIAKDPVLGGLCWHLGPKIQNESMLDGYHQDVEDRLLQSIDWPSNGYRLFDISTIAPSSNCRFLGGFPAEASWISLPAKSFFDLGGYNEKFQTAGGGLVNHDFRNRALDRTGVTPVMLLGEGLFHQFHGGVATNIPKQNHPIGSFKSEYLAIRNTHYRHTPCTDVAYVGRMHKAAAKFIYISNTPPA